MVEAFVFTVGIQVLYWIAVVYKAWRDKNPNMPAITIAAVFALTITIAIFAIAFASPEQRLIAFHGINLLIIGGVLFFAFNRLITTGQNAPEKFPQAMMDSLVIVGITGAFYLMVYWGIS